MEHFPRYWPFVGGIQQSPVDSPHKRQWRGALMYSSISAWTNGWTNNRDAGDLISHHAHYDITVMFRFCITILYDKQLNGTSGRRLPVHCEYYFGCQRLRMWLYNTLDEKMAVESKTTNLRYRSCPLCHWETTSPGNETYRKSIEISILRLDNILWCIFWIEYLYFDSILTVGLICTKSSFVQVIARCWTGDNPLPNPIMTQFTDAYVHHQVSISLCKHPWLCTSEYQP